VRDRVLVDATLAARAEHAGDFSQRGLSICDRASMSEAMAVALIAVLAVRVPARPRAHRSAT
jgi:hypothetical protein